MALTRLTRETYRHMLIDAGDIRVGYTSEASPGTFLSATRGGNTFTIEQEIREMPVDGAPGPCIGSRRIVRVVAKLVANCIEHSAALWVKALPGAGTSDETTYSEITRTRDITDADYMTNVAIRGLVSGEGMSGTYAVLLLKNAISVSNFELAMTDKDEAVYKLELTAHFDADDLDTEPWLLQFPVMTTEGA